MKGDSEFRVYTYIERVLKLLGWDTKNPKSGGQVYTQGEFRGHNALLTEALGRKTPENIVVIPWDGGLRYWVVEAKSLHSDIKLALSEAMEYAEIINKMEPGAACFATGIAGSPDESFFVSTNYWNGKKWDEIKINH